MHSSIPFLIFYFGALKISEAKKNPAVDIGNLLNYLAAQQPSKKNTDELVTIPYSSGYPNKEHDSAANNNDLMNLQTLSLLFKSNNKRNKKLLEKDLEQTLRDESDRICKTTGKCECDGLRCGCDGVRCGCDGVRCGKPNNSNDLTVHIVDKILKDLENELNEKRDGNNQPNNDNRSDKDNFDKNNKDSNLKSFKNDLKKDLLNIVFLEASDLENKRVLNQLKNLGDDIKIVDLRDTNLQNILHNRKSFDETNNYNQRTATVISPEDFSIYYEKGKKEITNELTDFVKGKKDSTYMAQLSQYQRYQINALKKMQSKVKMSDDLIHRQVMKLVFGASSAIRILPQSQDTNIYVPQLIYEAIDNFKEHNNLRNNKNMFPLTLQQKNRLQNKVGRKIISKFSWRRNMQPSPKHGLPFNLNVQGLGQFNK